MLEQNVLLMPYEIILWFPLHFRLTHIHSVSHIQILIKLNLSWNEIGNVGAQHLGDAIRNDMVIILVVLFISYLFIFQQVDNYYI